MSQTNHLLSKASEELRIVSAKIRAISHLIESQRDDLAIPLDIDDIHFGLAELLSELAKRIRSWGVTLEKEQIRRLKNRK